MRYGTCEVRDLVLMNAAGFETFTGIEVQVRGEIVIGNKVGMVTAASGEQLIAKARVLVDFEHVNADVRNSGCKRLGQREVPALRRLVRKTSDQIDADVADSCGPQPRDVVVSDGTGVQTTDRSTLLIDERLYAKADAIDSSLCERVQNLWCKRSGSAFYGNLRCPIDMEVLTNRLEHPQELVGRENGRGSATEIDAVDLGVKHGTQPLRSAFRGNDLHADLVNVTIKGRAGKNPRGKVAKATL